MFALFLHMANTVHTTSTCNSHCMHSTAVTGKQPDTDIHAFG